MKIKRFEYRNKATGWGFEPIEFNENLNLLVGVSGAGKTKILQAILDLKKIAQGESLNGVCWDIQFLGNDGFDYHWKGEFEVIKEGVIENLLNIKDEKNKPKIICEKLIVNGEPVIKRDKDKIKLRDDETPRLSPFQSALEILKLEEKVSSARSEIDKIVYSDSYMLNPSKYFLFWDMGKSIFAIPKESQIDYLRNDVFRNYKELSKIKVTLPFVYSYLPKIFNLIKQSFQEAFNNVEDIKLEAIEYQELTDKPLKLTEIYIKEKGVSEWISQENISSGMFKTLIHIAEIYLSASGSIILIDEFENSLGVNCINEVTDAIQLERRDLQFIITSHHPYIINNIPMDYWKIVTRKGSTVKVKNREDLGLGRSKHEAFIQLINRLEDYSEAMGVG